VRVDRRLIIPGRWRAIGTLSIAFLLFVCLVALPVTAHSYNFTGHVYAGSPPDMTEPVTGVRVELYGGWGEWAPNNSGSFLTATTTNEWGEFTLLYLPGNVTYPYYHVVEVDPPEERTTWSPIRRFLLGPTLILFFGMPDR
jgi:hypothetical protein